jgi:hypothetical protein
MADWYLEVEQGKVSGAAVTFASSNAMADPSAADKETSRSLHAQPAAATCSSMEEIQAAIGATGGK